MNDEYRPPDLRDSKRRAGTFELQNVEVGETTSKFLPADLSAET